MMTQEIIPPWRDQPLDLTRPNEATLIKTLCNADLAQTNPLVASARTTFTIKHQEETP